MNQILGVDINLQLSHFKLDVTFHVANEIVVLFGPSGSGKTSILNCIAGLMKPDKGTIRLNRKVLFSDRQGAASIQSRKVGYLFQDYALFPHMTIWKNIMYGSTSEKLAKEVMHEIDISHLKAQYPHEISGGEKQRVALARVLATEPEILLLDEAFSALDEKTRAKSHDQLLRLHKLWEIPVLLVTHDKQEANKLANRKLYIDKGKMYDSM